MTTLLALADQTRNCTRCVLSETRAQVVFGSGSSKSEVFFVGEAPGATEDQLGVPFVGRSGRLIERLCSEELGLSRDEVYIANVIKCRPPDNRDPKADEIAACTSYLHAQLALVAPRIVIPVGNFASRFVLESKLGITKLRGKVYRQGNVMVVPTYHPAAVLRGGSKKLGEMREDFRLARKILSDEKVLVSDLS